ncbi:hypothetical protein NVP1081O_214 [Vibrio phage 1.081.O._10N.286.52.C2]|nr:hypothetical protein NVP1081O_214 [Vibrio phage 1.081.O._10N.286.52.C2]
MSVVNLDLSIKAKKVRGWWSMYAGVSKLNRGFRTEAAAIADYENNKEFYDYWAGSAGVCGENLTPVIINV